MLLLGELLGLVDYIENFDEKGIQLVLLSTPVRSGSMLLHSLLDNHPQVLQLPIPFFYFFDWESTFQFSEENALVEDFFSKSAWLSPGVPRLGEHRDIHLDLKFDTIKELMLNVLPYLSGINRRKLFLLFHFAYAHIFNIDLQEVKVILHYHHDVPNIFGYYGYLVSLENYVGLEDLNSLLELSPKRYETEGDHILNGIINEFPNCKLLVTIRNPLSGLYSNFEHVKNQKTGNIVSANLATYFLSSFGALLGYYNLVALSGRLGTSFKVVKFEDIHMNTETLMRDVAAFLNIDYTETMLSSTLGGYLWSGSLISNKVLFGTNSEMIAQDQKWRHEWDTETIAFFVKICNPIARFFGYPEYETLDLASNDKLISYESSIYQQYPQYLMSQFSSVIKQLQEQLPPFSTLPVEGEAIIQAHHDQLSNKMSFYFQYPLIRQKILQYFESVSEQIPQGRVRI